MTPDSGSPEASGDARRVAGTLVRHRTRLRRLDLPVADHHAAGEPSVRAARLWAAADIERWERLLAATGRLSAPAALAAAVASLVEAGCGGWPVAARDPDRLGAFDLVRPDGRRLSVDLTAERDGRTVCVVQTGPHRPEEVFDYADPLFLVRLAARLRAFGLAPGPPGWPAEPS